MVKDEGGRRKVLTAAGTWLTPLLFGVMDDRSRAMRTASATAARRPATLTNSEQPMTHPQPRPPLQPIDLPPLPDAGAVALVDVLYELLILGSERKRA